MGVNHLGLCHVFFASTIKSNATLSGLLKRVYLHIDKPGAMRGNQFPSPTIGDLPALDIRPLSPNTRWVGNRIAEITDEYQFTLWTPEHSRTKGEDIWLSVFRCLFQEFDGASTGTGATYRLLPASETLITEGNLGENGDGPAVTVWQWTQKVLVNRWDPSRDAQ